MTIIGFVADKFWIIIYGYKIFSVKSQMSKILRILKACSEFCLIDFDVSNFVFDKRFTSLILSLKNDEPIFY